MKSPQIRELEPNKIATGTFLVQAKEIRQKKSGEPYLSLLLGDRSGELDAKMWDNVADVMHTFERDDFVRVKGLLQIYNNRPQFTIHKMQRVDDATVDLADFLPASARDPDQMLEQLRGITASMKNAHLRALVDLFLADEKIAAKLKRAPAAKFIHHAFLGGLIEHILSLCELCRLAAGHYSSVDLDLMLAGAVLHDIGKIDELSYQRSFSYSSDGQLLGHITIALRMIEEKLRCLPDFPPRLRTLVEHLVLSHHGSLEFGSPKLPMFPEALLLHYLDDMDAKMECMRALIEHDRQVEGYWTGYSAPLERVVLKKLKYLAEGEGGGECLEMQADRSADALPEDPPLPFAPAPANFALTVPSAVEPPRAKPAPAPPSQKPQPPSTPSLFGEKLAQALGNDEK